MSFQHFQSAGAGPRQPQRFFSVVPASTEFGYGVSGLATPQTIMARPQYSADAQQTYDSMNYTPENAYLYTDAGGTPTDGSSNYTPTSGETRNNTPALLPQPLGSYIPTGYEQMYYSQERPFGVRPILNYYRFPGAYRSFSAYQRKSRPRYGLPPAAPSSLHHNKTVRMTTGSQSQTLSCEVCKVKCEGQIPYDAHMKGQRHLRRVKMADAVSVPSSSPARSKPAKNTDKFFCAICQVYCSSANNLIDHERGAKHRRMVKMLGREPSVVVKPEKVTAESEKEQTEPPLTSQEVVECQQTVVGGGTTEAAENPEQGCTPLQQTTVVNEAAWQGLKADEGVNGVDGIRVIQTGDTRDCFCTVCNCHVPDASGRAAHVAGRRHRKRYYMLAKQSWEKQKKPIDVLTVVENEETSSQSHLNTTDELTTDGSDVEQWYENIPPKKETTSIAVGTETEWLPIPCLRVGASSDISPMLIRRGSVLNMIPQDAVARSFLVIHPFIQNFNAELLCGTLQTLKPTADVIEAMDKLQNFIFNAFAKFNHPNDQMLSKFSALQFAGPFAKDVALKDDRQGELLVVWTNAMDAPFWSALKAHLEAEIQLFQSALKCILDDSLQSKSTLTLRTVDEPSLEIVVRMAAAQNGSNQAAVSAELHEIEQRVLIDLQRVHWFEAVAHPAFRDTVRILRCLRKNFKCLQALDDFTLEVMTRSVVSFASFGGSASCSLSLFNGVCEKLAGGTLLPNIGKPLYDPCSPEETTDLLEKLTTKKRLKITAIFQDYLIKMSMGLFAAILTNDDDGTDESESVLANEEAVVHNAVNENAIVFGATADQNTDSIGTVLNDMLNASNVIDRSVDRNANSSISEATGPVCKREKLDD